MWFEIQRHETIATPALAIYPNRVRKNIRSILKTAKSNRLCPHVKTHKMTRVLEFYIDAGIQEFKCSTVAELYMVANSPAAFGLLAFQPVGPHIDSFVMLTKQYPNMQFATIVDNLASIRQLAQAANNYGTQVTLLVDLDVGMGRTGVVPQQAFHLYEEISRNPVTNGGGLHVYDGHIHDSDIVLRTTRVEAAMEPVLRLREQLIAAGMPVPRLVAGGTPSFPIHAQHADRTCSPGTPVFWDAGYEQSFPDLVYEHAAVLLTRVVSKLAEDRVCLDLGYKAIASEQAHPRSRFLNLADVTETAHSEEHLVIQSPAAQSLQVGDLLYTVPRHVCPTVALYDSVLVIEDGNITGNWNVTARHRWTQQAAIL